MTTAPAVTFEPPDTISALPRTGFEFSASARDDAGEICAGEPEAIFRRLLADQESEGVLLAARRILGAFLGGVAGDDQSSGGQAPGEDASADEIAAFVTSVRASLAAAIEPLTTLPAGTRDVVLRQRAPLALMAGCWLDVLSQPATQPSVIVNRLFIHHFLLRGQGNPRRSLYHSRRRRMDEHGVYLPDLASADFLARAQARPLTALHGAFYLALSRLPASFLPELAGVHYAFLALGTDDLLLGMEPMIPEADLRSELAAYLDLAGPAERRRLHRGIRLVVALEREHVAMLTGLARWHQDLTLESKVAAIVARHAPYAGSQHQKVKVGGRLLTSTFTDPGLDIAGFLGDLRESPSLRPAADGLSRFIKAIKFGGPMFGIFDEGEAATFAQWVASVQAGERPEIVISGCAVGDQQSARWASAIAASEPDDVVIAEVGEPADRELFYRLVNIETRANTLPYAKKRAEDLFRAAEILFTRGAEGRYTDASYFDFTPQALYARMDSIYWEKLVRPYKPLEDIPDRDEVVFLQSTYALGALIDAAWLHRTANLGRFDRPSDAALFSIYGDEVGHGDLRKNHITLIHKALNSMDIRLPHIREAAFMDQADLPDELYGFSLHQLCMAQFPDTYYNEILGYNLAIEMFGLGELRLHEIQKMARYGFDDCYERAHLTIDNVSAGHSRQAADIIVTYLDQVRRTLGERAVEHEWRRIWRGYASLAYFVEHALRKKIAAGQHDPADGGPADDGALVDLVI